MKKLLLVLGGLTFITVVWSTSAALVAAQDAAELEILKHRQVCQSDNPRHRRACVQFGMLIERNKIRHEMWRRSHPDWFWWER